MKKFGLVGKSLAHSFSKDFFNNMFKNQQISAKYLNFELDKISSFKSLFANNDIYGLNVTIPYKEKVLPYLDKLDNISKKIGSVNTILPFYKDEKIHFLKGYNTDVFGFDQLIKPYLRPYHSRALILGTGGSSKAVSYVLKLYNIDVNYISRERYRYVHNFFSWKDLNNNIVKNHSLIINTTPIGMFPNQFQEMNFPYQYITKNHLVIDLIYNPVQTIFLKKSSQYKAKTLNGYEMLVHQALKAWQIWNSSTNIK